jgi:hypothetical protein
VLVTVPSLFTIKGSDTTISTADEERRRLASHRKSNWVHVKAMLDVHRRVLSMQGIERLKEEEEEGGDLRKCKLNKKQRKPT